jgi:hypothetical protein
MHCNAPGSRTGSSRRFTSRSKSFLGIYSRLSVQEIHVTWNLTILCTEPKLDHTLCQITVYSLNPHLFQISFRIIFLPTHNDKFHDNCLFLRIFAQSSCTMQVHALSFFQMLTDLWMQNLEFKSVKRRLSLMRHTLTWWPKTAECYPVSRTFCLVIRTLISLHRCVTADVIVRVVA